MTICSIVECGGMVVARGWCCKHYGRWHTHGDPLKTISTPKGHVPAWIEDHASHLGDECLIWPFARHKSGYAKIANGVAIRVMCEAAHGPAPTTKHEVAHSCGKGADGCINPRHLRWATRKENHADKVKHGTHRVGTTVHNAKLTENEVRHIRELKKSLSYSNLSLRLAIPKGRIESAIRGWKHVA